jgi:thioredoxin
MTFQNKYTKPEVKGIIVLILLVVSVTIGCAEKGDFKQVNPVEFQNLISKPGGILLDVRTQMEFKNGHIQNSGQLNFYAFDFKNKLLMLPKNEPIYLYCNTGYRSEKAARFLMENGYKEVYNLQFGIMDWELENLPVLKDPDAKPDTENKIELEEFDKILLSEKPVFIDFYAPWCGPCRTMMPMIDSLKVAYHPQIDIVKINVDASKKLVKELGIKGVPYLAFYKNGKLIYSKNGMATRNELTGLFDLNL